MVRRSTTIGRVPVFICPHCGRREQAGERHVGHQPRGCSRCGFGFLFELLEDYYPGPRTGLIVCDKDRRVLAGGRAADVITGYREVDLLGREIVSRLGIVGANGEDPIGKALEWGVRVLGAECTFRPNGVTTDRPGTLDCFPAYDNDGGLLVALTAR